MRKLYVHINPPFINNFYSQIITIMKILSRGKQFIKECDLFSTSQFLRYNSDEDYKTASGGLCSLIVVAIFIALFMSTALETINMNNITWTSSALSSYNPTETRFKISPNTNPFMFAVQIFGVDLNNATHQYFDVILVDHRKKSGFVQVQTKIEKMVPCTQEHFAINQEILTTFRNMQSSRWLCPPIGYSFGLHGKYTSETTQYIEIMVKKCNDTLNTTRVCVTDSQIDQLQKSLGKFYYGIFFVNALLNPGEKDYLSYYLQDRNYISFTRQLGVQSNGFIQDFQISTDSSLLPFTSNTVDRGTFINEIFQNIVYSVTDSTYASFNLNKSSRSESYVRSFTKIDTFFSYVGGLVGTILGFMIIMKKYSQFSFDLELGQKLFWYKQDEPNDFGSVNILNYVCYLFFCPFRSFKQCKKWQKMKQIYECREEMVKQLSIDFILSRVNFLQGAIETLLSGDQIEGLHLQKYETVSKVKERREKYKNKYKFNNKKDASSLQSQSQQSEKDDQSKEEFKKGNSKHNIQVSIDQIQKRPQFRQEEKVIDLNLFLIQRLRKDCEQGNQISMKILDGINQKGKLQSQVEMQQQVFLQKKIPIPQYQSIKVEKKILTQDQFIFQN